MTTTRSPVCPPSTGKAHARRTPGLVLSRGLGCVSVSGQPAWGPRRPEGWCTQHRLGLGHRQPKGLKQDPPPPFPSLPFAGGLSCASLFRETGSGRFAEGGLLTTTQFPPALAPVGNWVGSCSSKGGKVTQETRAFFPFFPILEEKGSLFW